MKRVNIVNKKFGKLFVIAQEGKDKQGHLLYKCQCDCGNITYATTAQLKNGLKLSCGCAHYDRLKRGYTETAIKNFADWVCDLIYTNSKIDGDNCASYIFAKPEELQKTIQEKVKEICGNL